MSPSTFSPDALLAAAWALNVVFWTWMVVGFGIGELQEWYESSKRVPATKLQSTVNALAESGASAAAKTALAAKRRKDPPRRGRLVEFCEGSLSRAGVRFYTDECANGVAAHLVHLGLDVLTSTEAGMDGEKDDRKQLLVAQRDRRILVTYNVRDFLPFDGVVPHAGMLLCPQGREFIPEIQRVCLRLAERGKEARA